MKKIVLIALAATAASVATPALADVTGTVLITGSVTPKCLVVPNSGSTFGTTVGLGELAGTDGKLRTGLATDFNATAGLTARVVCTSAAPTISVDATPLATLAPADAGYDNSIDFEAEVLVDTTTTADVSFKNDSADAAGAVTAIGGRLANNGGDNITIKASNFRTTADALLVADPTYTGQIQVVIAPGA